MARGLVRPLLAATAIFALLWVAVCPLLADVPPDRLAVLARQQTEYAADAPKSILELQPFRSETRLDLQRRNGVTGTATLTNLSPDINSWYLLSLEWPAQYAHATYHLENPARRERELHLVSKDSRTIGIELANGSVCRLWSDGSDNPLEEAAVSGLPYAPLCGGALYLRNVVAGHRTSLERVTDFLRDRVWGGDQVVEVVKRRLYRDKFLERGTAVAPATVVASSTPTSGPAAASVAPESAALLLKTEHLALDLDAPDDLVLPGQWYPVHNLDSVRVSVIAPEHVSKSILANRERTVNSLGAAELSALAYLVAFDLRAFDLHYVLGTDHPRLEWSERPPRQSQDSRLPGPDGVGNPAPLVTNGMINPWDAPQTVAAFTGGFKRAHAAFRTGPLSLRNHGSHYGFIEDGVIFSKLQPGLATTFVTNEGRVAMKTWAVEDNAQLPHIRYARQNGVPLIEYHPELSGGAAGEYVNMWGAGNWSGSSKEDLRTLRAGLCLQENQQRRYLIYGYFSDATPSAMTRVFEAYGCRYAMHLDMNALEHTYLALYPRQGQQRAIAHLVDGMKAVDRTARGQLAPRFLAFPDDRDFFYLTRGEATR